MEVKTFKSSRPLLDIITPKVNMPYYYLYHGIRYDNKFDILDSILDKGVLCNDLLDNDKSGEYISLISKHFNDDDFNYYIESNLSLVINPNVDAMKCNYGDYIIGDDPLVSYVKHEYKVKHCIDVELIEAIGVPYDYLMKCDTKDGVRKYMSIINEMLKKYELNMDIVDTSNNNKILVKKK